MGIIVHMYSYKLSGYGVVIKRIWVFFKNK